jgi:hypothetical protein
MDDSKRLIQELSDAILSAATPVKRVNDASSKAPESTVKVDEAEVVTEPSADHASEV